MQLPTFSSTPAYYSTASYDHLNRHTQISRPIDAGNRQRWKPAYRNGTSGETTIFVGGILEKRNEGSYCEYRHTMKAGNKAVALYTRPTSGPPTIRSFLLDRMMNDLFGLPGHHQCGIDKNLVMFGNEDGDSQTDQPKEQTRLDFHVSIREAQRVD